MSRIKGSPKTGGRKAGTPNKRTAAALAIVDEAGRLHRAPMEYLTENMDDPTETRDRRFAAAGGMLPYVHPRLMASAVVSKRVDDNDEKFGQIFAQIEQMLTLAPAGKRVEVIDMLREDESN